MTKSLCGCGRPGDQWINIDETRREYLCNDCRSAKVIRDLMKACDELMHEGVSKKRAADWCLINDALVNGGKMLAELSPKVTT
jgi:hypothetical protein